MNDTTKARNENASSASARSRLNGLLRMGSERHRLQTATTKTDAAQNQRTATKNLKPARICDQPEGSVGSKAGSTKEQISEIAAHKSGFLGAVIACVELDTLDVSGVLVQRSDRKSVV